jgi:hypothetical protein
LIAGFGGVVALVLSVWLLLPLVTRGASLEGNRWVREGLALKLTAARARPRKVVLLGGSNVLFGLSARRLEEAHGIPAVNLGQHAGLGRRYILHYGLSAAQPGDLIVLSLEYALWESEKSRDTRNYYVLAHDSAYLYGLPPHRLVEFLAGVRFVEWRTLLEARLGAAPQFPAGYDVATIDAWGDETRNAPERATPAVREAAFREPTRGRFVLDAGAVREVRQFGRQLGERDARLVVTFPPILRRDFAWEVNQGFYGALLTELSRSGLAVAGRPEDSPFDGDCLFDSRYHVVQPCTHARTDRLADELGEPGVWPAAAAVDWAPSRDVR